MTYQSGGPGSNGPPSIVASPGATLQSGVWAITFTLQFSTETSQVTTLAASSLTASSAALNGTVNPEGDNGYAGFYWGTDPHLNTYNLSCTSWYYCASVTPNSNTQSFTANLGSLSANTTYYYRMVFYDTSNGGYQYGDIVSFTTNNPTVTTRSATGLTASGVAMNGSIDPEGANGYAGFYWAPIRT